MINIQIITKNNEATIEKCINSILPIKSNIKIIDLNSTDNTLNILKKYKNIKINTEYEKITNFSKLRNNNLAEGINFYINPWEELISGHNELNNFLENKCYSVKILINKNIFFENRIFYYDTYKFENPFFESVYGENLFIDQILIKQLNYNFNYNLIYNNINLWKEIEPLSKKPYYYECYLHLNNKNYLKFIELSSTYLNNIISEDISSIILRYNLACVQSTNKNSIKESIKNIMICILNEPSISEFWCLLGDIHYKIGLTYKAISFYENALIVKNKRINNFPIEIEKLKKHPENMIEICNKLIENIYP